MATYNELRTFGGSRSRNTLLNDVINAVLNSETQSQSQRRGPYGRGNFPACLFEDDSETQDPNLLREQSSSEIIMKELHELKDLMKDIQKRQGAMEKAIKNLATKLDSHEFDLGKSSHAANVTKILAKAYIQLGRFSKANESKTEQLKIEFQNSPYGLKMEELMSKVDQFEGKKFTYWRAEERRRILGIGSWSSLEKASTKELASKICGLLGVKFNATLEHTVLRQTALVKMYIAETGRDDCTKDDKFWINFQTWKEATYGVRGPSLAEWDEMLNEE